MSSVKLQINNFAILWNSSLWETHVPIQNHNTFNVGEAATCLKQNIPRVNLRK